MVRKDDPRRAIKKTHPGGLNDVSSNEKEARMYLTDQPVDGYKALAFYLQKVNPNCSALFSVSRRQKLEVVEESLV